MKNAIFVIIFFLVARPVIPVLEYAINYDYIVKELCINKARPQMHCNGKCHLMKELAKAAEQDKPLSEKKGNHAEVEVLFYQPLTQFTFTTPVVFTTHQKLPIYCNLYSHLAEYPVFHPPLIAV